MRTKFYTAREAEGLHSAYRIFRFLAALLDRLIVQTLSSKHCVGWKGQSKSDVDASIVCPKRIAHTSLRLLENHPKRHLLDEGLMSTSVTMIDPKDAINKKKPSTYIIPTR